MSREDGFSVMDVSTSWHDDPKWKAVWRRRPDLIAPCAYVYMALVAESWRTGGRLTVSDAWPTLLPYDADVVAELMGAKLIDRREMVPAKVWSSWFDPAVERQRQARERWRRANEKRHGKAIPNGDNSDDNAA